MDRLLASFAFLAASTALANGSFTCEADGTATICPSGGNPCFVVGPCELGCDSTAGCQVPSNVAPSALDAGGDLVVPTGDDWLVSSDDGRIVRVDGGVVRPAGPLDPVTGTRFALEAQTQGGSTVGVLSVNYLVVAPGSKLRVAGTVPLVIHATDAIAVQGTVDVGATQDVGGPGGFNGGLPGQSGAGPGAGVAGAPGTDGCQHLCSAGSSGASYGAAGGLGGGIALGVGLLDGGPVDFPATPAAPPYGTPELVPLVGGSGGAGGVYPGGFTSVDPGLNPAPGRGGGGGGALQLISRVAINVAAGGLVSAPGGGGEGCVSAGGASGGSGGALLFEAPIITVDVGGVVAANGGGGGSADCT